MVNSSGLEKIYTLMDGQTDEQKSDLYSKVALANNQVVYYQGHIWINDFHRDDFKYIETPFQTITIYGIMANKVTNKLGFYCELSILSDNWKF